MMKTIEFLVLICVQLIYWGTHVHGHGRLMDPPARNAMWRFGYPNPVNYNDNELFCGGYAVQWEQNEGKCGVCGDAYHVANPRPHEAGGTFANGILSRFYSSGQQVDVEIELTANHYGFFVLKLCPNNNPEQEATQECFDQWPLRVVGQDDAMFFIPRDSKKKDIFRYQVQLPSYVTCTQCIIQWTYYTGNMWGTCSNGTEAVGCGKAETFRNCADVAIVSHTGGARPPLFAGIDNPYLLYYRDWRVPSANNVFPLVVRDQICVPTSTFRDVPGMGDWCQSNCLRYPPNCPETLCHCPSTCEAIGEIAGKEGADVYCQDACINYKAKCPAKRCRCH